MYIDHDIDTAPEQAPKLNGHKCVMVGYWLAQCEAQWRLWAFFRLSLVSKLSVWLGSLLPPRSDPAQLMPRPWCVEALCRELEALLMRAILPRPSKTRVGVLGQHEGGGSEYLIRKIKGYEPFRANSVFLQNTLENVTERYLWARKTSFRSCCAWVKRFMTYDCAPRAPTCDKKFEESI